MIDIDWSKAPEGATHYCVCNSNFYKVGGDGSAFLFNLLK